MKTLIIATIIASSVVTVSEVSANAYCTNIESLAKYIMRNRQNEVAMSEVMKKAGESKVAVLLTEAAYKERAQRYGPNKERKIKQFGNKYYLLCHNAAKKIKK